MEAKKSAGRSSDWLRNALALRKSGMREKKKKLNVLGILYWIVLVIAYILFKEIYLESAARDIYLQRQDGGDTVHAVTAGEEDVRYRSLLDAQERRILHWTDTKISLAFFIAAVCIHAVFVVVRERYRSRRLR